MACLTHSVGIRVTEILMRICGLFYDGVSKSDYAASSDRMTDEFVRIRKEAVLTNSRYARICLEGLKLIAKHLSQGSR